MANSIAVYNVSLLAIVVKSNPPGKTKLVASEIEREDDAMLTIESY